MKIFYALRETAFGYDDDSNFAIALNKIYKNYDTLEAAQKAKNELNLQHYRFQIDIENLTKDYALFIHNRTGINHLDFLKKQYSIDFEGLLESKYLKDFKYKTFVGWLSVELFEHLLEDRHHRLPLPKREPLRSQVQLMQYHYREQKRSAMGFAWSVQERLYPTCARDGKYTNCWNRTGTEPYAYAATHFKIDFQAIWASKYFKKFKYKQFLDELFPNFFWTLVSLSDKAILDWVEKGYLGVYEIMEATEKTVFYKIYTNPDFTDFQDGYQVGADIESDAMCDHEPIFYANQQEALKEMSRLTAICLDPYYEVEPERYWIGTLDVLSEMPILLKAYIIANPSITYDDKKERLFIRYGGDLDSIVLGLISLLRPVKLPYKLVEIPIAHMEERYFTLEKERAQERNLYWNEPSPDEEEDFLPF